jgi:quinol monooxygenase YgiN
MIIISLTFSPRKDVHDEVLAAWAEAVTASRAQPGCITYAVSTELLDPTVMRLYEEWETHQALIDHMEMPYTQHFHETLAKLGDNAMILHSVARYEATPLES